MRLIDADALIEHLKNDPLFDLVEQYGLTSVIETEITIEAEPVRHGQWIGISDGDADGYPVYDEWECSECGVVFEDEKPPYKYCPNCGAKMDINGDDDNE